MNERKSLWALMWRVPLIIVLLVVCVLGISSDFFVSVNPPPQQPPRAEDNPRHATALKEDKATWSDWERIAEQSLHATVRIVVSKHLGIDVFLPDHIHITNTYGSGFIFKNDAGEYRVMSAGHLVAEFVHSNALGSIEALTYDDQSPFKLELIGFDVTHDVSLFRFKNPEKARDLPTLPLGIGSMLNAGERIMTIGHPASQEWAVTFGFVSKPDVYGDGFFVKCGKIIAHTSKTNYGNSGGPVINSRGEVVGVNILLFPLPRGSGTRALMNDFFGGAISIDDISAIMPYLEKAGGKEVKHLSLGMNLKQSNQIATSELFNLGIDRPSKSGIIVVSVSDRAQNTNPFKLGDVIVSCNGTTIRTPAHVWEIISHEPLGSGKKLVFSVIRDGKEMNIEIQL